MDLGLDGRVALVTGGSKGIGLAVARQLAEEGAELVLVARTQSELAAAAESIAARTGRAPRFATADVGDDASVAALAEQVGPVQILVNAAATPNAGGFPESELADHVNVKVAGALRTARAFAPGMVTAAEVADVVAFLASPRSVAINGDVVAAGGGARGAIHY